MGLTPTAQNALLGVVVIPPASLWSSRASFKRGTLRVIPVTLPQSTHYILTLNHIPVDSGDDMDALITLAKREWAEVDEVTA